MQENLGRGVAPPKPEPIRCAMCDEELVRITKAKDDTCGRCGWIECWAYASDLDEFVCAEPIDSTYFSPDGSKDGGLICGPCIESFDEYANVLTIHVPDQEETKLPYLDGIAMDWAEATGEGVSWSELPEEIQAGIREIVGGTTYVHTDAWRGHYETKEPETWTQVLDDCALWGSEDERNLERFNEAFERGLGLLGIPWIRAITKTSNLFAVGVDLYVPRKDEPRVSGLVALLKVYRDPDAFKFTAWTGKDPKDAEPIDRAFVRIADAIMNGVGAEPAVVRERVLTELVDAGMNATSAQEFVDKVLNLGGN